MVGPAPLMPEVIMPLEEPNEQPARPLLWNPQCGCVVPAPYEPSNPEVGMDLAPPKAMKQVWIPPGLSITSAMVI